MLPSRWQDIALGRRWGHYMPRSWLIENFLLKSIPLLPLWSETQPSLILITRWSNVLTGSPMSLTSFLNCLELFLDTSMFLVHSWSIQIVSLTSNEIFIVTIP